MCRGLGKGDDNDKIGPKMRLRMEKERGTVDGAGKIGEMCAEDMLLDKGITKEKASEG